MRRKQKVGIWALVIGLIALSFSGCTSAPAPIEYASRISSPIIAQPIRPSTPLDLSAPYWDEFSIPRVDYSQATSECVPFARNASGVQIWGDAVTWWDQAQGKYPRSSTPAEGSVLVLKGWQDDKRGHVAVVKRILSERVIRVDHANWLHGGEVALDVPVIDVSPENNWTQVRVWHVPGMYWGGRAYQAQGFIHPFSVGPTATLG